MDENNALIAQRRAKLEALRARGLDPFRNKFTPTLGCGEARSRFLKGVENPADPAALVEGASVALAGRITAHRDMGRSQFLDLKDQSGRIQIYAQKQVLGDEQYDIFKHLDLADFIGVTGTLFRTRTGEPSVKVERFTILAKALRPPPAKWHGLEDTEIRYRQRYLDLMANDAVKRVFLLRSEIIREIRAFFHARGYVEVETPTMQAIPGGAAAQPFKTWHNALGCEFYLRIALELYLKRLLVGGFDKVFEIGRNFRNEGLSRRHNPEFTMLEAYEAYGDYATMMETVESLVCHVAQQVLGTLVLEHPQDQSLARTIAGGLAELDRLSAATMGSLMKTAGGDVASRFVADIGKAREALVQAQEQVGRAPAADVARAAIGAVCIAVGALGVHKAGASGHETSLEQHLGEAAAKFDATVQALEKLAAPRLIDLTRPWRREKYKDLVRAVAGADWFEVPPAERRRRAIENLKLEGDIGTGYEDFEVTGAVFEKLVEPTLIQPTFVTHLPKELVPLARLSSDDPTTVEVFELCIGGQEIAPGYTEQNDPIEQRERLEHQAGGEQQKLDEDFLVALEHGMPPAGGIGIGIDRLCMLLLGQESIRDVILFPQLKPK
jgi:lysyl-tRNA synthetase class 2